MELKVKILTEKYVDQVAKIESDLIQKTTREKVAKTINSRNLHYYVLCLDDEVIGFLEISIIDPEIELFDIAVKKEFQGNGYSKVLMDFLIDFSNKKNITTIFLEVNSINKKAIALYEKYGFNNYAIRKKYYGDNDAILMKKTF